MPLENVGNVSLQFNWEVVVHGSMTASTLSARPGTANAIMLCPADTTIIRSANALDTSNLCYCCVIVIAVILYCVLFLVANSVFFEA